MNHLDSEYDDLEIGPLLRRLRGDTSLREVRRLTGMSNVYLSQVEKGEKHPGPRILRRLAALYGVSVDDLLRRAGYMQAEGEVPRPDAALGTSSVPTASCWTIPVSVLAPGPPDPCPWNPSVSSWRCTSA